MTSVTRAARQAALGRAIARLSRQLSHLQTQTERLATLRLGAALLCIGLAYIGLYYGGLSGFFAAVLPGLVIFVGLVVWHRRLRRAATRLQLAHLQKQQHLARMSLQWDSLPNPQPFAAQPNHPYETDLDIIGPESLHHLLNTAVTERGGDLLRAWLTPQADALPSPAEIGRRQAIQRDLVAATPFREKLAIAAKQARLQREGWRGERWQVHLVESWIRRQQLPTNLAGKVRILAFMAAFNIGLALLLAAQILPGQARVALVLSLAAYLGLYLSWGRQATGQAFDLASNLQDVLAGLANVFAYIERYPYGPHSALRQACAAFTDPQTQPSAALRRIGRLLVPLGIRQNSILWALLNGLMPFDLFFTHRLALAKQALDTQLPRWLSDWYQLEALASLATFAYLNPAYAAPCLTDSAIFTGLAVGHPLIATDARVCNDFSLETLGQTVIITGSNMAGKSSFLRAVGINLCLTYAGGNVCANQLLVGQFRLFTCIRVSDSVTDGFSYFYAEVRRLKALLDALQTDSVLAPPPLFFLIDEIFRGTNNRERLLGSQAYIRALAGGRGMGLISTHDLELVQLADNFPLISNKHFREHIDDGGQMVFDYLLRPGPCPTTNALIIMARAGLPTPAMG
jgi:ABC-type multidrug transport system fused ATPase/permease subunit